MIHDEDTTNKNFLTTKTNKQTNITLIVFGARSSAGAARKIHENLVKIHTKIVEEKLDSLARSGTTCSSMTFSAHSRSANSNFTTFNNGEEENENTNTKQRQS